MKSNDNRLARAFEEAEKREIAQLLKTKTFCGHLRRILKIKWQSSFAEIKSNIAVLQASQQDA